MKVFAVIAPAASEALTSAIQANFPGQSFTIAPGQYLVATVGQTAREVGARIGDQGQVGQVFIVPFEAYHGWHRPALWEWATARALV